MGEDSLIPRAKKVTGQPAVIALIAMLLGAGGASAVTISFGGDEASKPAPAAEVQVVKETQKKHEKRIEQNEQGMITVRIALEGMKNEMENQTEDIGDIKESLQRMNERRGRSRDRDRDNP